MQKIEISNGYVMVKEFVDRKSMRLYRKALFVGANNIEIGSGSNKNVNLDPASLDEGNDILVRNMIVEANIENKNVSLDDTFFDSMKQSDFDLILNHCVALIQANETEKKS